MWYIQKHSFEVAKTKFINKLPVSAMITHRKWISRVIFEQWKFMALDYGKRRFKVKHSAESSPSKQTNLSTKHSYKWEFLLRLAYSTHRSNKNHSIPFIRLFEMCSQCNCATHRLPKDKTRQALQFRPFCHMKTEAQSAELFK